MRNLRYLFALLPAVFLATLAFAQDFSNKGKDFWVGYGLHCRMFQNNTGGTQEMVLYFATEAVTNVTVSIPALGFSQVYNNIPANTIFTTNPLPKTGAQDARLTTEGVSSKGIHITSDKPIVAYAHIYNGNVSGATLLFPTNTLGKEYYALNFSQYSNEANSNSFFYAVATDTGTTTVEVIPSANTLSMNGGATYTFNLTQGQVLNVLGELAGNNGVDLTGSKIRSISTGTGGCKRIAVFSGSGKINIKCPVGPSNNSADNFMVQAFPKNAWGKSYLTVPTSQMSYNFFRIAVSDPTAVVKVNGTIQTNLINGFYYQIGQTATPNLIESDKPIMVAQYITSANVCGNTAIAGNGDPEVIYLSPVEQNINRVILNSTPNFAIIAQQHYLNVVIPNTGTAISSFRIDGQPPTAPFVVHPQKPNYSYLVQNVSQGQHIVESDSGFNAIAYGYGGAESYGYNAGANVKDLYQFVSVQNQYATVDFPAACKSSPFYFSAIFPYQPTQIKWIFGGLFTDVTINTPAYDSTWTINGRQLYRYKLPTPYTISTSGTYPIRIVVQNPTPEGCSGEQEVNYDLQVFERPIADFNFSTTGCVSDSVKFFDNANPDGRTIINYSWNFGDGGNASVKNPSHLYTTAGSFNVKYSVITDIGCLSDTVAKTVVLTDPPVAKFGITYPLCVNQSVTVSDSSSTLNGTIVKWTWNFGDGSAPVVVTSNASQTHSYAAAGNYIITLKVENSTGCQSLVYSMPVTVAVNPAADYTFGNACLPSGQMQFTNNSSISDGTLSQLSYLWGFSDGGSDNVKDPVHNFNSTGPFTVKMVVTSIAGCRDSITKTVNTVYAHPQASFSAPAEVCLGTTINFTDQSTAPNSTITQWNWNFGDGNSASSQNPSHNYAAAGTYIITLTSTSAIGCISTVAKDTVIVHQLPTSNFTISAPVCETQGIVFTDASAANSGNIIQWTWDFNDGNTQVNNTNAAVSHNYAATGVYNATLVTQTDKGCISPVFTLPITVHPLPVAGFTVPANCLTDPFSPFFDTSSIADGTQAGFTYLWNFGDPNANGTNPNISTLKNPTHKYTATGTYNVTLTVTSVNGCASTLTQPFTLNGTVPQSVFSINGGLQHCSNNVVTVTNLSTVDVGNVVKLEIFWDYANDPTNKTVALYPLNGASYNHNYPEFFSPATKTYEVRVVAYSGDNCLHTSFQTITVKATPLISFNDIPAVCADAPPFQLTQASVSNLPGTPLFSGNGISPTGLFNPQAAGVGTHTIRYSFTASNGCMNMAEKTITVYPVPIANAGPDLFILEGGSATITGSGSGNNPSYSWTPVSGLNNPSIPQPVVSPVDDITYTLIVTSADGCTASDQVFIKVLKTPAIPNTFSPNGDGIHDRWEIKYLDTYPGATIEIYNRYGQLVYKSVGYSTPWDGKYKGSDLPAGTYYYIINPKNGRKQLSGFVDIIR